MTDTSNFVYHSMPDWSSPRSCSTSNKECTICGAPSNGYHFNAPSCSACAAFFRRTVTLNRKFVCSQQNYCRVNYAMRVICRACRYSKCIQMGMDRTAVQPRRDCNAGRRKILYHEVKHNVSNESSSTPAPLPLAQYPTVYDDINQQQQPPLNLVGVGRQFSPDPIHYAQSYSSSISEDIPPPPSPKISFSSFAAPPFISKDFEAEQLLDDLMREENLFNERRKLLYCSDSSISKLLINENVNDIPYTDTDIKPLTFAGIQKHIRPQILVIYEWLRGWRHFQMLNTHDRLIFLRRCVLYHTILDPSFLSFRLGLPKRFIMFNAMYVGIDDDDMTGWEDEADCITSELKIQLYRPLMTRVVNEICSSMSAVNLSFVEFVILKALVSFKSAACSDISLHLKKFVNSHLEVLLRALNLHYQSIGLAREEIAQRTGNLVLMMSNIFAVGMECLESHQKIQFFDLWQLDDLLIKLISRASST